MKISQNEDDLGKYSACITHRKKKGRPKSKKTVTNDDFSGEECNPISGTNVHYGDVSRDELQESYSDEESMFISSSGVKICNILKQGKDSESSAAKRLNPKKLKTLVLVESYPVICMRMKKILMPFSKGANS